MKKIFGTATLHRLSIKSRNKVIESALHNGFSQFDTSGVYGLGSTNKYLGSLGISNEVLFSAKLGLKSGYTIGFSRLEILLRKLFFPKLSKIQQDNCYSNWQRQFETQMTDLGVNRVQRLLLHERYITKKLWKLFKKFLDEYRRHFDEYGVSASWATLHPTINCIYDDNLLIQTTPEVLFEKKLQQYKKIALYGISKKNTYDYLIENHQKNIESLIYFSSKISRIRNFSQRYKNNSDLKTLEI